MRDDLWRMIAGIKNVMWSDPTFVSNLYQCSLLNSLYKLTAQYRVDLDITLTGLYLFKCLFKHVIAVLSKSHVTLQHHNLTIHHNIFPRAKPGGFASTVVRKLFYLQIMSAFSVKSVLWCNIKIIIVRRYNLLIIMFIFFTMVISCFMHNSVIIVYLYCTSIRLFNSCSKKLLIYLFMF